MASSNHSMSATVVLPPIGTLPGCEDVGRSVERLAEDYHSSDRYPPYSPPPVGTYGRHRLSDVRTQISDSTYDDPPVVDSQTPRSSSMRHRRGPSQSESIAYIDDRVAPVESPQRSPERAYHGNRESGPSYGRPVQEIPASSPQITDSPYTPQSQPLQQMLYHQVQDPLAISEPRSVSTFSHNGHQGHHGPDPRAQTSPGVSPDLPLPHNVGGRLFTSRTLPPLPGLSYGNNEPRSQGRFGEGHRSPREYSGSPDSDRHQSVSSHDSFTGQGYRQEGDEDYYHGPPYDESGRGSRAPRRRRTTPRQLHALTEVYERTAFPSTQERQELAERLKMQPRQVQIWFQNRRQQEKHRNPGNQPQSPNRSRVQRIFASHAEGGSTHSLSRLWISQDTHQVYQDQRQVYGMGGSEMHRRPDFPPPNPRDFPLPNQRDFPPPNQRDFPAFNSRDFPPNQR